MVAKTSSNPADGLNNSHWQIEYGSLLECNNVQLVQMFSNSRGDRHQCVIYDTEVSGTCVSLTKKDAKTFETFETL